MPTPEPGQATPMGPPTPTHYADSLREAKSAEGGPTPEDLLAEVVSKVANEFGVPADLLIAACEAAYGTPLDYLDDFRSMGFALRAVLPVHREQVEREVLTAQRAELVKGIREYFAAADDPLYEDVRILCDRIERGEYGGPA